MMDWRCVSARRTMLSCTLGNSGGFVLRENGMVENGEWTKRQRERQRERERWRRCESNLALIMDRHYGFWQQRAVESYVMFSGGYRHGSRYCWCFFFRTVPIRGILRVVREIPDCFFFSIFQVKHCFVHTSNKNRKSRSFGLPVNHRFNWKQPPATNIIAEQTVWFVCLLNSHAELSYLVQQMNIIRQKQTTSFNSDMPFNMRAFIH